MPAAQMAAFVNNRAFLTFVLADPTYRECSDWRRSYAMVGTSNKEALKRFGRAQGNGVFRTLVEIVFALLIGLVLSTILGVLTF